MKRSHSVRIIVCLLSLLLICSVFAGCGKGSGSNLQVEIYVDNTTVILTDAQGKTVAQLLEEAKITLNEGDVVTIDNDHVVSDGFAIRVLRIATVTFEVLGEDGQIVEHYKVAFTVSTVADAMKILDIQLSENQEMSVPMEAKLKDGMTITITLKKEEIPEVTEPEEPEPEETEPEETEPEETEPEDEPSYEEEEEYYEPTPTTPPTQATVPPTETTAPPTTVPPTPTTEPTTAPTEPERTIVSVEYYDDPDGSGHGVKVITYSDGTQEEIAY